MVRGRREDSDMQMPKPGPGYMELAKLSGNREGEEIR